MQKNIAYLNGKAWYRLIKVLYLLILLITLVAFNVLLASDGVKVLDKNKTLISCSLGSKATFPVNDVNAYFSPSDFKNGVFDYEGYYRGYNVSSIQNILKKCYPKLTGDDIYDDQKEAELVYELGLIDQNGNVSNPDSQRDAFNTAWDQYTSATKSAYSFGKISYLKFDYKQFDIKPSYSISAFLRNLLIGNIIILVVFEILRRIFYYILLGKLNPKKTIETEADEIRHKE